MTSKQELAEKYAVELAALARETVDANHFFVLGTSHPDGQPRVSPVYFNHHEYRAFYWVSSPDSQHSRNLAADPRVNAVVFDSSVDPGPQTAAVYLTGAAVEVPQGDLESEIPRAFDRSLGTARSFTVDELSGTGVLRLYRLDVTTAEVHARGGHPLWGLGVDTRLPVTIPKRRREAGGR